MPASSVPGFRGARAARGAGVSGARETRHDAVNGTGRPVVLAIAGSDSGGGAGVAADLKALAASGVHGAFAITAVTAQNTLGVHAIAPMAPKIVAAQVRAVVDDMRPRAVKVGMLANARIAGAVADELARLDDDVAVVVDPVLCSSSGTALIDDAGLRVLVERILPRATVITPNLPEAQALVKVIAELRGAHAAAEHDPAALAVALLHTGTATVVLTGGHTPPPRAPAAHGPPAAVVDVFAGAGLGGRVVEISGPRVSAVASHGSGCTHSALLAAALACGKGPLDAARAARRLTGEAIAAGHSRLGAGGGAVDVLARGVAPCGGEEGHA
jgi:hydroxymethylpyrimidine/phosphomethylpyrimidine kinase